MAAKRKGERGLALDEPHSQHNTKEQALLAALRAGNYIDSAAEYAGLGERTVRRYISEGRNIDARIAEHNGDTTAAGIKPNDLRKWQVWQAIQSARASAEVEAVSLIRKAARDGTWQAAAWFLERSAPGKWGRRERGTEDAAPTLTAEQAKDYLSRLPDSPLAKYADN